MDDIALTITKDTKVGLLMTRKTTEEMTRRTVEKILNNTKMAEAERAGMFQDKDRDDVSNERAETMLVWERNHTFLIQISI